MVNLRSLWKPALYHGHHKRKKYFEGWYYKIVDASGNYRYAVIPGVFLHENPAESHSFIQTLDGITGDSTYHRYPLDAFQASEHEFDIQIAANQFRGDSFTLDIDFTEKTIKGELYFKDQHAWPVKWHSPGVMGWYSFAPFMECYHGVLSFDHEIDGSLTIDNQDIDFTGGKGYMEKDWGKAFPSAYIWMQTNHFNHPHTCLTGSIAMIPWLWYEFRGYIVGFWHDGQLYRFTTYTGAKSSHLDLTDSHVHWQLTGTTGSGAKKGRYRLEINAERASGGILHAPDRVAMIERIVESLTANIEVNLIKIDGPRETTVFHDTGRYGGLEVAGDLDKLLNS